MNDKIVWQLEANASQIRAEMDKAVASVQGAGGRIAQSWGMVDARQKSLLESNNRVTNQFQGFARTLLNANSATDVLASGLDRLENSLNLSLAGGAMLAGGAVLIDQIGKFRAQIAELEKAWQNLMRSNPDASFQTLNALSGKLEKIIALRERLEDIQNRSPYTRIGQDVSAGLTNQSGFILGAIGFDAERQKRIKALREMEDENKFASVDKRRARSDLDNAVKTGAISPYEAEAAKLFIAFKEANPAVHELTQATIELHRAFQDLAKSTNDKKMERSGMSLKEMAALPDVVNNSVSFEQYQASQQAKKALALDAAGEAQRLNFNPAGAHDLFNQAGEAKEGITGLKPSEKMSADFKGALAVSEEQLKIIAENTAKQFVNR